MQISRLSSSTSFLSPILFAATLTTIAFVALLSASPTILYSIGHTCPQKSETQQQPKSSTSTSGWQNTDISSASQGTVWHPRRFRSFSHPLRTARQAKRQQSTNSTTVQDKFAGRICKKAAVVTTIFEPTTLAKQLKELEGWCLIVVGDKKTNHEIWTRFVKSGRQAFYLSPEDQDVLGYNILKHVPWNHFGRKNVGYMRAIQMGAELIWDADDDNPLLEPAGLDQLARFASSRDKVTRTGADHQLYNPYPRFLPTHPKKGSNVKHAWPRGFPLEYVMDDEASNEGNATTVEAREIGVFQSLANNDPDVDAVYRMTRGTPMSFRGGDGSVALALGRLAPFNAQATLWTRRALWGMVLPVTVHGRVTDIWRSYIAQRVMKELGLHLAFTRPVAVQYRNIHSLVADLQSEVPLYTQANELTRWSSKWEPAEGNRTNLGAFLEQLVVDLYEIGIVEEEDVLLFQSWLDDLEAVGYEMPEIENRSRGTSKVSWVEPKDPVFSNEANVAVCVSGNVRSLSMKLSDKDHPRSWELMDSSLPPPNMTVAESIQKNLYPNLGNPDVFMVVSTRENTQEPRVGDTSVCEPLRPHSGHIYCSVRKENAIKVIPTNAWETFKHQSGQTSNTDEQKQRLLQQLKGLYDCYSAIQEHSVKTGKEYDWVVQLQPDTYIHSFPTLEQVTLGAASPTIWYPSTDCRGENEEGFGIGAMKWMRGYSERLLKLQQVEWGHQQSQESWTAQYFLNRSVAMEGVALRTHPGIKVCALKPKSNEARDTVLP